MKKTLLIIFCLFGLTGAASAQNAYYDAQGFAGITQAEADLLKAGPLDAKQYSDEEITTIAQAQKFLQKPFNDGIDRKYLNPKVIRKIIVKLNLERHPPAAPGPFGLSTSNYSGMMALPGGAATTLSSFGNTASRLGSADFQTILIDATAKYLAESFKEDMTYLYFSKLNDKLNQNVACKYLIPNTSYVVGHLSPFNFKNLGDSWKAAFEKDIQIMPLSFVTYVKVNAASNQWCAKVNQSSYFKYYSYSVDILQPLIKGEHPVEVLESLDKNYYQGPDVSVNSDRYKSFIHLLNILQFNLQDSTKKSTDKQYENLWLSYSQLSALNTPKKLLYYFALVYQQDPAFFKNDLFGIELATVLKDNANYQKVIDAFSNLLILLNQVEGNIKTIDAAKTSGTGVTGLSPTYLKTVLSIADSTNSFLKKISLIAGNANLKTFTDKVDQCLNYGDDAYQLYADITAKNYQGVFDDATLLLKTIDKKDAVSIQLVQNELGSTISVATQIKSMYDTYSNGTTALHLPVLDLQGLTGFVNASINNNNQLDPNSLKIAIKGFIGYAALAPDIQAQIDAVLLKLDQPVATINTYLGNAAALKTQYTAVFAAYTKTVNGLPVPNLNQQDLVDILSAHINYNLIDEDGVRTAIEVKLNTSTMTAKAQQSLDDALKKLNAPIDVINKALTSTNNGGQLQLFLKTVAIVDKYGEVIAGVANAQNSDELEAVIQKYIATSASFLDQRTSLSTFSVAAKVGASFGMEGNDRWQYFKSNLGLTVPLGFEFTWGNRTGDKTNFPYVGNDSKIHYLTGASHGVFIQVFDIAAVVNYRLSADSSSSSLPQKVTLAQVFSPGITYNWGLKNCPFDIGVGAEYTPELRKIGSDPQASSVRVFLRIAWDKPLIFISNKTEKKKGYALSSN